MSTWPVAVVAVILAAAPARGTSAESFTATVVPSTSPMPRTWDGESALTPLQITIHVERWSPPEETLAIKAVLDGQGPAAAARRLAAARAGTLVPPAHQSFGIGTVGSGREPAWRLALACSRPTATGREVVLVTDRPLNLHDRSGVEAGEPTDPRLGAVVLSLDARGRGQGRLLPLARVRFLEDGGVALEELPAGALSFPVVEVRPSAR